MAMIEQTLHGYHEGHRLLASSCDLVPRDARLLLGLSDASGSPAGISDDGYLTGHPLLESAYYALSRTWPAPEISRPGCVWTHSILIPFDVLDNIGDLEVFASLLARPVSSTFEAYRQAILAPPSGQRSFLSSTELLHARPVLWRLYGSPSEKIVAIIERSSERVALAVWSQQWGRLRRAFRFSLWSMSDRSFGPDGFDIQFVPSVKIARIHFRAATFLESPPDPEPAWLRLAAADLDGGDGGVLRRLLRDASADVARGRTAFASLCELCAIVGGTGDDLTGTEAALSKLQEFQNDEVRGVRRLIAERVACNVSNTSDHAFSFLLENLDLLPESVFLQHSSTIGRRLFRDDRERFVLGIHGQERIAAAISGALQTASIQDISEFCTAYPEQTRGILEIRPDFLRDASLWSTATLPAEHIRDVALRGDHLADVVSALVLHPEIASRVRDIVGSDCFVDALIAVSDASQDAVVRSATLAPWWRVASRDPGAIAAALANGCVKTRATLSELLENLGPDDVPNEYGSDPVVTAALGSSGSLTEAAYLRLAAFFMARGLGFRSRSPAELLTLSFATVYQAAARSDIDDFAWKLLDKRLPNGWGWAGWDRCKRICVGVAGVFVERRLSARAFAIIEASDEAFLALSSAADACWGGPAFLRRVREELDCLRDSRSVRRLGALRTLA